MPRFEPPLLRTASYILEFSEPVEKIRFEQARAEDAFRQLTNTQSEQTNVPDGEDPSAPRIVFPSERKAITISQIRCGIDFNFKDKAGTVAEHLETVEKNAKAFHLAAISKFAIVPFGMTALILAIQAESRDEIKAIHRYIFDQYLKTTTPLDVASARVAVGFRKGQYFVNLGAEVYETRRFLFTPPPASGVSSTFVKPSDTKVMSSGLQIRIDINDKPAAESGEYKVPESSDQLFHMMRQFMDEHFQSITGVVLK